MTVIDDDTGSAESRFFVTVESADLVLTVPESASADEGSLLSIEDIGVFSSTAFSSGSSGVAVGLDPNDFEAEEIVDSEGGAPTTTDFMPDADVIISYRPTGAEWLKGRDDTELAS